MGSIDIIFLSPSTSLTVPVAPVTSPVTVVSTIGIPVALP